MPFLSLFLGEGSPTKTDCRRSWYPYCLLEDLEKTWDPPSEEGLLRYHGACEKLGKLYAFEPQAWASERKFCVERSEAQKRLAAEAVKAVKASIFFKTRPPSACLTTFWGEGSPTTIDYGKNGYPCSNLSTGGPRRARYFTAHLFVTHSPKSQKQEEQVSVQFNGAMGFLDCMDWTWASWLWAVHTHTPPSVERHGGRVFLVVSKEYSGISSYST